MRWQFRSRHLQLDESVHLMGVVNVTPDSFSDGGRFIDAEAAVEHGVALVEAGAHLLDIGGESTRPGADPVDVQTELERVLPVIRGLRARVEVPLSIDTAKAVVAQAALEAGAEIVNDISALGDPDMAGVVAASGAGLVLMHMRGAPRTMQQGDLQSPDIVGEVQDFLRKRLERAQQADIDASRIALDPGIGFGKTFDQNVTLLGQLGRLSDLGRPLLVGVSRKAFLGALTGRAVGERLFATAGACACAVLNGAHILRVHDVAPMRDVARVAYAIREAAGQGE